MMNGLLGTATGQMAPFHNHHHYSAGSSTSHHFGQMYAPHQRSSFAIQELLGLNSCRSQNGSSPDLMDTTNGVVPGSLSSMYPFPTLGGTNASAVGAGGHHRMAGVVDAGSSSFLREQQLTAGPGPGGSPFCPWRFDPLTASQQHTSHGMVGGPAAPRFSGVSRHTGEDLNFGYKHSVADEAIEWKWLSATLIPISLDSLTSTPVCLVSWCDPSPDPMTPPARLAPIYSTWRKLPVI
ncbi:hypothetical protein ACOMHN_019745 [Nucella lapillus]